MAFLVPAGSSDSAGVRIARVTVISLVEAEPSSSAVIVTSVASAVSPIWLIGVTVHSVSPEFTKKQADVLSVMLVEGASSSVNVDGRPVGDGDGEPRSRRRR